MTWKHEFTRKENGKDVKYVYVDETNKPYIHNCKNIQWKYKTSFMMGNPRKKMTLWSFWKCEKCGLVGTQTQTANQVIDLSDIKQPGEN